MANLTEEAKAYFEQMSPKSTELSDEELDNVAGGAWLHPQRELPDELSDDALENVADVKY